MKSLGKGEFYGQTNERIHLNGITITDTEYTHAYVDWHYHEHPYFTFILDGLVLEGNKKEIYHCSPGSLLFHNWQDAHYNIKPDGYTRGFQIELDQSWMDGFCLHTGNLQGSQNLQHPDLKLLMYQLFKTVKTDSLQGTLAIESLLLTLFSKMSGNKNIEEKKTPGWVLKLHDLLHDTFMLDWSLQQLAAQLDIHPVHLSRDFTRYFHCNLGVYIRKLRIQYSLSLLSNEANSLTEIAVACGFADQSHFIRCFKLLNQVTPSGYRKLLFK